MSLVDEARKLLVVREVIDTKHFTGVWRGQPYECRALPDTSSLSVGDAAFCHVLPGNTELVAILPGNPELWFSPGSPGTGGELWKIVGHGTPALQLSTGNGDELFTHLALVNSVLYAFTFEFNETVRVYRVNRSAATLTLLATWVGSHPYHGNPVGDSAEFGGKLYTLHAGWNGDAMVRRFDPATNAFDRVYSFLTDGGVGYGGGIAVDPLANVLVATDGDIASTSPTGNLGDWTFEAHVHNGYYTPDNFCLITNRDDDDLIYMGMQGLIAGDPNVLKRTAGMWADDLTNLANESGVTAFTQEHTGAVPVALYGQEWGAGPEATPCVWRKAAAGGAWAVDWSGPPAPYFGLWSQGICYHSSKVYSLWKTSYGVSPSLVALYRRTAGLWALVQTWTGYDMLATTHAYVSCMATVPEAVRLCHEV